MKLNLYKCSAKDREWYTLAKEIRAGAIALRCSNGPWPVDMPPGKIEFFKEVEIDLSSFLENEIVAIKEENRRLAAEMTDKTKELEEYKPVVWRLYFK